MKRRLAKIASGAMLVSLTATADMTTEVEAADKAAGYSFPSQWIGVYEPAGRQRGPKANRLTVKPKTFSWGNCENTSVRIIAEADDGLVFQASPVAKCGWAGWIIEMHMPRSPSFIYVTAYRSLDELHAKKYGAHYSFEKVAESIP